MNHEEIQAELARISSQVAKLAKDGFDEDVLDEAQERLAELKAAAAPVLERDDEALRGIVARNVEVWRDFKAQLRQMSTYLESLLE